MNAIKPLMNNSIVILGSARRNGNTGKFVDWIFADSGIEVIDLNEIEISPFDYEHNNIEDDFLLTMNHILKHENIIFASPVYWFSMSAQMKVFIDRLSDFLSVDSLKEKGRQLRNKKGYVVSTSISEFADASFTDSFSNTFKYLGMKPGLFLHLDCKKGFVQEEFNKNVTDFIKDISKENRLS